MKARLVVIVVNWNGGNKLLRCLDSLHSGLRDVDFVCVVVDNASTDGSADQVRDHYQWVRLLRNPSNLGFSNANNQALDFLRVQGWEGDYVLFLNNDTELESPGFNLLLEFMDQQPDVAALTPVLIEGDGRFQVGAGGRRFTWFQILAHFFFLNRLPFMGRLGINLNQSRFAGRKKAVDLDWICGTAMLVRRSMMGAGDFFPREHFMYFEDVVVSGKLLRRGRLVYYPGYCIRHHRHHGDRNLEFYFQALQKHLHSQGFSPLKLRITRGTIYLGLTIRKHVFGLMAMVNQTYRGPYNVVCRQIRAMKLHWLT